MFDVFLSFVSMHVPEGGVKTCVMLFLLTKDRSLELIIKINTEASPHFH